MEEKEAKKPKDSIWKHAKIGNPEYKRPKELWDDAIAYFEWCDKNPVDGYVNITRYKKEKKGNENEAKKQDHKMQVTRPYTLFGFCAFSGITSWARFKAKYTDPEKYLHASDFDDVIRTIENVIASQQVDGAMAGMFKENLVARLNGIADKTQQEVEGSVETRHNFTGFNFLPTAKDYGLVEEPKISIEEEKPKVPLFAEVVDYESVELKADTSV